MDIEKGLNDKNINLLYDCIHGYENNYIGYKSKKNEIITVTPPLILNYKPKNFYCLKYDYCFDLTKSFWDNPQIRDFKTCSKLPPILILSINDLLINKNTVHLLRLLFEAEIYMRNNWKAIELLKKYIFINKLNLSSSYNEVLINRNAVINKNLGSYIEILENFRKKNLSSVFEIVKEVIYDFLVQKRLNKDLVDYFKNFDCKNIFECSIEIQREFRNIKLVDNIYTLFVSDKERIIIEYLDTYSH